MNNSKYRIYDKENEISTSPKVEINQFVYDPKTNVFSSTAEKLYLQPNERFAFFLMRGKIKSYTFIYAGTKVMQDGSVIDCYTATSVEYKAEIERKISTEIHDNDSII